MFIARRRFIPVSQNKSALSLLSSVPFHITHTFLSFPSIINHYLHPIITHTHTHPHPHFHLISSPSFMNTSPHAHTHTLFLPSHSSRSSPPPHMHFMTVFLSHPPPHTHTLRKNSQFKNVTYDCSSRSYPHPHTPTLSFSKSFFSIVPPPEESRHS